MKPETIDSLPMNHADRAYVETIRPGLRFPLCASCNAPNTLTDSEAQRIARRYGLTLDRLRADLEQANTYGQTRIVRPFTACVDAENAQLTADHLGRYQSAAHLLECYARQIAHESACESREAIRNEDRAHGRD
jgi:hypothetical protein